MKNSQKLNNVSPENITSLNKNEVFVFGSNKIGHHAGGAARQAFREFGAVRGNGFGFQGKSFAIPTLDEAMDRIDLLEMQIYVDQFISLSRINEKLNFLVTEIGCGIAGFKKEEIAPLFKDAMNCENIYLPKSFLEILTITNDVLPRTT